jgi:hypothetical protein
MFEVYFKKGGVGGLERNYLNLCCGAGTAGTVSFCRDQNRNRVLSLVSGSVFSYEKVPIWV